VPRFDTDRGEKSELEMATKASSIEGAAVTGFNAALAASKRAKPEEMAMAAASGG